MLKHTFLQRLFVSSPPHSLTPIAAPLCQQRKRTGIVRPLALCLLVIGATPAVTTAADPVVAAVPANCGPAFPLKALISGHYVSTEIGFPGAGNGLLRARSPIAGPWEKYRFCYQAPYYGLRSEISGLYVSVEIGYAGGYNSLLRARSPYIGPWERFNFACEQLSTPNPCYLYSAFKIYAAVNGRWVTPEIGYTGDNFGMLRARTQTLGTWERFSSH